MDCANTTTVHGFLEGSADKFPGKVAFVQGEQRVTYDRMNAEANALASFLLRRGVGSGDRVVILLKNSIEYVVSYYGTLKAGGVAVPLSSDAKRDALAALLQELEPKGIICCGSSELVCGDLLASLSAATLVIVTEPSGAGVGIAWEDALHDADAANPTPRAAASSLASIIYTSGSTGKPKGVMLSHGNIAANTKSIVQYLELSEKDVQMVVLPFFYVMGKSLLNTHVAVGGTVVVNNDFAYTATVIGQMAAEHVTGFSGVPSTYAYLLHRSPLAAFRDKLPSLRYCTQAGGHMPREIKEKLLQVLPPHTRLFVMYGATEAAARLTYVEPHRLGEKLDSIGKPIPGVTVRILDEKGQELPCGSPGELVAAGENIMMGYWRDPDATARAIDRNGYHTGDIGYCDQEGYFYVTGRKDDLLKVGGHRIDPREIEETMMSTGMLLEVAVMGIDDELLGKRIVAVAVPLDADAQERDLALLCHQKLSRHKVPADIRFVPALPKHASGKIDRASCLAATGIVVEEGGGPPEMR